MGTGLVGLFLALVFLSKTLRHAMAGTSENAIRKVVGLNPYVTLLIGTVLTVAVQSSSITTSIFVPLVGTGILTLEQVYPLTLGANLGTTVTALLASMVGNKAAISIALTHLCFNLAGTLLFLPLPFMRWPVGWRGGSRVGRVSAAASPSFTWSSFFTGFPGCSSG